MPLPPHKLRNLMLLLLAGLAAPAVAQTTVTSSGRDGPTACLNQEEVNATSIPITALSTTAVTFTRPVIRWDQYVGRLGDVPAPESATMSSKVFEASTKTEVGNGISGPITPFQIQVSRSQTVSGLTPKTSYYAEVAVTSSGKLTPVFARRCFMTGGSYTIPANPIASGPTQGSTGCFTITALTQQDVRDCWCGRTTTRPLFSATQDNTDWANMWGCR